MPAKRMTVVVVAPVTIQVPMAKMGERGKRRMAVDAASFCDDQQHNKEQMNKQCAAGKDGKHTREFLFWHNFTVFKNMSPSQSAIFFVFSSLSLPNSPEIVHIFM
jgi:hypothetical protein